MARLVKGSETDKWLPKHWRKTTFPILREPASGPEDIVGSAFLIHYHEIIYVVSAKHVIDKDSLVVMMPTKEKKMLPIPLAALEEAGAKWIPHPAGLDLAAIPFPDALLKRLDVRIIGEDHWVTQTKIMKNSEVVHLGFPEQTHAYYEDGTPAPIPIGMRGRIIGFQGLSIQMKTAGAPGASGGPVFLKREGASPLLIGVATNIKLIGKPTRPSEGKPLHETSTLPISLIKDILESKEMVEQCKRLGFSPTETRQILIKRKSIGRHKPH